MDRSKSRGHRHIDEIRSTKRSTKESQNEVKFNTAYMKGKDSKRRVMSRPDFEKVDEYLYMDQQRKRVTRLNNDISPSKKRRDQSSQNYENDNEDGCEEVKESEQINNRHKISRENESKKSIENNKRENESYAKENDSDCDSDCQRDEEIFKYWKDFFQLIHLRKKDKKRYTELFTSHRITNEVANELTRDMLKEMGIDAIGDSLLIMKSLNKFKNDNESYNHTATAPQSSSSITTTSMAGQSINEKKKIVQFTNKYPKYINSMEIDKREIETVMRRTKKDETSTLSKLESKNMKTIMKCQLNDNWNISDEKPVKIVPITYSPKHGDIEQTSVRMRLSFPK
ncbi:hypothetical protein SNEBB_007944 [Seison nebaliae]|nr:hypothetical protein SNEBB_007944 [Seison nebaliae]